jgi:hypothetical protein
MYLINRLGTLNDKRGPEPNNLSLRGAGLIGHIAYIHKHTSAGYMLQEARVSPSAMLLHMVIQLKKFIRLTITLPEFIVSLLHKINPGLKSLKVC